MRVHCVLQLVFACSLFAFSFFFCFCAPWGRFRALTLHLLKAWELDLQHNKRNKWGEIGARLQKAASSCPFQNLIATSHRTHFSMERASRKMTAYTRGDTQRCRRCCTQL